MDTEDDFKQVSVLTLPFTERKTKLDEWLSCELITPQQYAEWLNFVGEEL